MRKMGKMGKMRKGHYSCSGKIMDRPLKHLNERSHDICREKEREGHE